MQWYYAENGQSIGPLSEEDFQGLVSSGKVGAQTMVWHEGMSDWVAYSSLSGAVTPPVEQKQKLSMGVNAAYETGKCVECGRQFPLTDMVQYEGANVCAECKPVYFQRLEEGATGTDGNTPNADLMAKARAVLQGNWGIAIAICVLYNVVMVVAQLIPAAGAVMPILIGGPMMIGQSICFLTLARGQRPDVAMLFSGFQQFGKAVGVHLTMSLFILLWMLLLIVPGIIAAYSYSQAFYIIADDPSCGVMEAIRRSKQMMQGRKWKFCCLSFRFIGWSLLCMLTLGIGFLWLMPYMYTSLAEFYNDVSQRSIEG